ncbi:hypothetical protein OROHE_008138 [Orobanche hederae]
MPLSKHQTVLLCGTLSREHHVRSYCCIHTRNMATTLLSTSGLKKSYPYGRSWAGRSDYVVLTEDAVSFAFGWNKHGQLGSVSAKNV